ncbi:LPS export ABC transporter periplasmic protein LptC [Mucilaginibacter sp. RS28]|uniref:LPS export ABC transporter periplasmic protein LptC n=1 Tax=Mucilaginibacter straminoryzae TaxID=2932774 RepID=A0A9X2BDV4_9SPHI|nr:LPS export ABC transporter periplasmic protein LptC [Mucilaginibacter straminoryzae]MCJ8210738.1 LPS export ABC transporter periplasmic protein LptC [Mucilaginibacter straminoryzae]
MLRSLCNGVKFGFTVAVVALLLAGCEENDLKKVREIASMQETKPVQRTTGVDVIYSDSAKVKARLTSPLMLEYTEGKKPYTEMPKGVKVVFFDANLKMSSSVVADYAIRYNNEHLIELRKNVVATNAKGDKFMSDELIWEEITNKVTSQKPVTIITTDGSVINGASLKTNQKFDPWDISQTTGKFPVNQNIAP